MNKKLLSRAAALLHEEAAALRESCQVGRPGQQPVDWACDDCKERPNCSARKRYDELLGCADKLDRYMRVSGRDSNAREPRG